MCELSAITFVYSKYSCATFANYVGATSLTNCSNWQFSLCIPSV